MTEQHKSFTHAGDSVTGSLKRRATISQMCVSHCYFECQTMSKKILEILYVVVEPSKTMKIMKDGEAQTFQRPVFELVVLLLMGN